MRRGDGGAGSSLAAAADVAVLQHVAHQRAVTHTQALAGAYGSALALWAALTGDEGCGAGRRSAGRRRAGGRRGRAWAAAGWSARRAGAAVVVGGGAAWAAALELALMLKEISRIPAEGVETREGATSAMFGLDPGHLMVSLDPAGDPHGRRGAAPLRGHRRDDAAAAARPLPMRGSR